MNLGDLIKQLEEYNPNTVVPLGFGAPHSYRGDYYSVAFEPVEVTTIGEMLEHAKSALGATSQGTKVGNTQWRTGQPVISPLMVAVEKPSTQSCLTTWPTNTDTTPRSMQCI